MLSAAPQPNSPLSHPYTSATLNDRASMNLTFHTREGDVVHLSGRRQKDYSSSVSEVRQDNATVQEFSTTARAASVYAVSVNGELNEEEMSAILRLTEKISPLVKKWVGGAREGKAVGSHLIQEESEVIEKLRLSVERTVSSNFEKGKTGENPKIRNMETLLSAALDSIFMAVVEGVKDSSLNIFQDYGNLLPFLNEKISGILASQNFKADTAS